MGSLEKQLVSGARQLDVNLKALHKLHKMKGLDLGHPYTKNTEDALKIQFANQALKGLKASKHTIDKGGQK